MGLIEQEIKELRSMSKKVLSGEISLEMASMQISIANQIAKRETLLYNMIALNAKYGHKSIKSAISMNLLGNGTAITVEGEGEEMIKCPEHGDKCITRGECLDYSGDQRNIDRCQSCEQFTVTRKQMAP